MIVLKSENIEFAIDSSQNISFENGIDSELKDLIIKQATLIILETREKYNVSDGFFETYLANNLSKAFDIISVKDEDAIAKREDILIY